MAICSRLSMRTWTNIVVKSSTSSWRRQIIHHIVWMWRRKAMMRIKFVRTCQIPLRIRISKSTKWAIFGMRTMWWANLSAKRNNLIQQRCSSSPVTTANALRSLVRKVLRWPPRFQLFSTAKASKKNGFHQTHSAWAFKLFRPWRNS